MADEEPVDQKKCLEDLCKSDCAKPMHDYGFYQITCFHKEEIGLNILKKFCGLFGKAFYECVKKISGNDTGSKHCRGQYFDYLACLYKCVVPKLFSKLK